MVEMEGLKPPDPLVANQTLYQLSYIPKVEVRVGFEPTNICFAGSGLGPLGHLTMIVYNSL